MGLVGVPTVVADLEGLEYSTSPGENAVDMGEDVFRTKREVEFTGTEEDNVAMEDDLFRAKEVTPSPTEDTDFTPLFGAEGGTNILTRGFNSTQIEAGFHYGLSSYSSCSEEMTSAYFQTENDSGSTLSGPLEVKVTNGVCLLIVNRKFTCGMENRDADHGCVDTFCSLLEECNIRVTRHEDRTAAQMKQDIKKFDTSSVEAQSSIVFVVVISHGSLSEICGTDGEKVSIREITDSFASTSARGLSAEVPKICIFQCCQKASRSVTPKDLMPVPERNFHVEYTTLPGEYDFDSFDQKRPGSVFFHELTTVMKRHIRDYTLSQMFTKTRARMQSRRLQRKDEQPCTQCSQGFPSLLFDIRLQPHVHISGPGWTRRQVSMEPAVSDSGESDNSTQQLRHPSSTDPDGYEECVPPAMSKLSYFYPEFKNKKEAKQYLDQYRGEPGHFLLRPSSSELGKFTFAITHGKNKLLYMRMAIIVTRDSKPRYTLVDTRRDFQSIKALVSYYKNNPIPNRDNHVCVQLRHPVCKSLPLKSH